MPRGCKPGERRGGREKGTRNRTTIERALIAEQVVVRAEMRGEKLGKEYLNDFAKIFSEVAMHYRPFPQAPEQNPNGDEDKFERWALHAVKTAKDLADFQSPRLKAIMVASDPGRPSIDDNVVKMPSGDPVRQARVYRMMLEGSPGSVKRVG